MGWFSNLFGRKSLSDVVKNSNVSDVPKVTKTTTTTTSTTTTTNYKKGMVNATTLNAREKASTSSKVLYKIKKNTLVTVLKTEGEWYKISTEAGEAYCMAQYITLVQVVEKVSVNANVLNVRSFYSTDSTILGKVYKGNVLVVLSKHRGWYGVDFNGKKGFVSAEYVTFLSDSTSSKTSGNNTKKSDSNTSNTTSRTFFNSRKDLEKVALAPKKLLSDEGQDKFGKVAVKTWNNYGNLISVISKELGIDVEIALAVICVESGGSGFSSDGKMIIRFENHVFYTYYGSKSDDNKKIFDEHFTFNTKSRRDGHKYRKNKSDEWITSHNGQKTEWESLEIARKIDDTKALYSISMGAPQVMGFNYKSIGYNSVNEMFNAFSKDIRYHIMALFDFCNAKSTRIQYLLTGDFLSFAKEYNGLTAPEAYEKRLQTYYDIYKKLL